MKGLITFLSFLPASAVLVVASPHLQPQSDPNILQTKRQSNPVGAEDSTYDGNYYPLDTVISVGRDRINAYDPSAALVSVEALSETYGECTTLDLLTNLTFRAVNSINGSLITMTAHHGYGFGDPQTFDPVTYEYLLSTQLLLWPIGIDAPTAFNKFAQGTPPSGTAENGTACGITLHYPSTNIGPYKAPEPVWTFYFGGLSACSVPNRKSVAGTFISCVG